ncbi:MAG: class I SAM-dependent methyltransferase [Spirochaetota bacterium]|nr:class I SAM-dependent methyltransferase [Spirochaetota bacterium]
MTELNNKLYNQHYKDLADKYNDALSFTEGYCIDVVHWIVNDLKIKKGDIVVDLGGGTGSSAKAIYDTCSVQRDILCIDPCLEMLECAKGLNGVSTLSTDALSFAINNDIKYNKIFIKEAVHHFNNRINIWKGIYKQLYPEGRILIITRPPKVEFPFFQAALQAFEQGQPHYNTITKELEEVGFKAFLWAREYPVRVDKEY